MVYPLFFFSFPFVQVKLESDVMRRRGNRLVTFSLTLPLFFVPLFFLITRSFTISQSITFLVISRNMKCHGPNDFFTHRLSYLWLYVLTDNLLNKPSLIGNIMTFYRRVNTYGQNPIMNMKFKITVEFNFKTNLKTKTRNHKVLKNVLMEILIQKFCTLQLDNLRSTKVKRSKLHSKVGKLRLVTKILSGINEREGLNLTSIQYKHFLGEM